VIGVFKVTAEKKAKGNYQTESVCTGRDSHTVYKRTGDKSAYKCPYCGHDVV